MDLATFYLDWTTRIVLPWPNSSMLMYAAMHAVLKIKMRITLISQRLHQLTTQKLFRRVHLKRDADVGLRTFGS